MAKGRQKKFDPYAYELVDWDDEGEEYSNLAHCMEHGVDEQVVDEVLSGRWVQIQDDSVVELDTAEFAIVGPDGAGWRMWTLLFAESFKRGDWLRPVTGWESHPIHITSWES
jgi:hypothetical protein